MNNIQETLFRTIETITEGKVSQIKFDKTIEALVVSDEKADVGEYQLRYQDLMFTAYSSNNTSKFKKDENVLVLVPDGDMSKRKTIVASNKKEGDIYVDIDQVIDRLGINFVDEEKDFKIGLSTFKDETVSFKLKKQSMIDQYPGQKFLAIGANIYTNISDKDREGEYGIAIDCVFMDKDGKRIPHTFKLSTLNVTGNPYMSRGYKETQIPLLEERLVEIVGARAYSKGYSQGNENIVFSNLVVEYVSIREQDKSEYSGNIIAPEGTHFRSNVLYPNEKLSLIMEFKQQGSILDTKAIDYLWFVLNGEITSSDDPKYHPDAGFGWEWIKSDSYDEKLIKGAGTKTLEVAAEFVPNFSTFKCIAYYTDKKVLVTAMSTLVDHTESIDIEITSDNGVSFVNGFGAANLTCRVSQKGKPIDGEIEYEWTKIKDDGNPVLISKGTASTINISASDIGVKSTYICEVSIADQSRPFATSSITVVNIIDGSTQGIVIVGGFRTVLYNADGYAPDNFIKEGFQFDVYDNGVKVTSGLDWTWSIAPVGKTLLTLENAIVDYDGRQTSKNAVLNLGVLKNFDISKMDNMIKLQVSYTKNNIINTLVDHALVSITKVGQNGADGAVGKPGQDGKTYVYEIQGGSPVVVYDKDGKNPSPKSLVPFKLMFSVDGNTELAKEVESVEWDIQRKDNSILGFKDKDKAIRVLSTYKDFNNTETNKHIIELVVDDTWEDIKYNNFISAKITYEGMIFRETYPISVTKNGSDGEMGLTIATNPPSYNINSESDGNLPKDVSILINFDIYKSDSKVENYLIESISAPPGVEVSVQNNKQLLTTFKKGYDLPDNGIIQINLNIESRSYIQSFSFSKTKNGESPYFLTISSTNGIVFKRGDVNTVLVATVYKGTEDVTNTVPQQGFIWTKINKTGVVESSWKPNYEDNKKNRIIVTPLDILERATFNCELEF